MNYAMLAKMQDGQGFIAALDQSGGSTPKALAGYGIDSSEYSTEAEMYDLVHEMRKRIITSPAFTSQHIIGAILFERTMDSKIDDRYTAEYLWEEKEVVPFLKIDKGLMDIDQGVQLMKPIDDLETLLDKALSHGVFGTKMRSVIYNLNEDGIKKIVQQQFEIAKIICNKGLVPIIEPEVNIDATEKDRIEKILKSEIEASLEEWDDNDKIMFKFTIPTEANLYGSLYNYSSVVRIVALSGGYDVDKACSLLSQNKNMPASFSRALIQKLRAQQTEGEFNATLARTIDEIYQASIDD